MSQVSPLEGTWMVISYRSEEGMIATDDRTEASFVIDGTQVAGSMGINQFSGQIEDGAPIGPLAVTRMAGPPGLMEQEDILLGHLQDADTIEVVEDGMTLSREGLLLVELERLGTGESV